MADPDRLVRAMIDDATARRATVHTTCWDWRKGLDVDIGPMTLVSTWLITQWDELPQYAAVVADENRQLFEGRASSETPTIVRLPGVTKRRKVIELTCRLGADQHHQLALRHAVSLAREAVDAEIPTVDPPPRRDVASTSATGDESSDGVDVLACDCGVAASGRCGRCGEPKCDTHLPTRAGTRAEVCNSCLVRRPDRKEVRRQEFAQRRRAELKADAAGLVESYIANRRKQGRYIDTVVQPYRSERRASFDRMLVLYSFDPSTRNQADEEPASWSLALLGPDGRNYVGRVKSPDAKVGVITGKVDVFGRIKDIRVEPPGAFDASMAMMESGRIISDEMNARRSEFFDD